MTPPTSTVRHPTSTDHSRSAEPSPSEVQHHFHSVTAITQVCLVHDDGDGDDGVSPPASPLQVSLSPRAQAVELGSNLVLTCRASGCVHPPTLTWKRLDQDQTLLQKTQAEDMVSLLSIQELDLQDQGEYRCEAQCGSVVRAGSTYIQVFCESRVISLNLSAISRCFFVCIWLKSFNNEYNSEFRQK